MRLVCVLLVLSVAGSGAFAGVLELQGDAYIEFSENFMNNLPEFSFAVNMVARSTVHDVAGSSALLVSKKTGCADASGFSFFFNSDGLNDRKMWTEVPAGGSCSRVNGVGVTVPVDDFGWVVMTFSELSAEVTMASLSGSITGVVSRPQTSTKTLFGTFTDLLRGYFFEGEIAEMAWWPRVVTAQERDELVSGATFPAGAAARFLLNEGAGTTLSSSIGSYTATIRGAGFVWLSGSPSSATVASTTATTASIPIITTAPASTTTTTELETSSTTELASTTTTTRGLSSGSVLLTSGISTGSVTQSDGTTQRPSLPTMNISDSSSGFATTQINGGGTASVSTTQDSGTGMGFLIWIGAGLGALACIVYVGAALVLMQRRRRASHSIQPFPDEILNSPTYSALPTGNNSPEYSTLVIPTGTSSQRSTGSEYAIAHDRHLIDFSELTFGKVLGSGNFGQVCRGEWREMEVAIKEIKGKSILDAAEVDAFLDEAGLMAGLTPHANVVQLVGFCRQPLCIVTEFCEDGSLDTFLADASNKLSQEQQRNIMLGLARGMLHLARSGLVHKDLAARNALITRKGDNRLVVKVGDLGLSRVLENSDATEDRLRQYVSQSNNGPLRWMAPESLGQRIFGEASDVWGWGCVGIEVLTRNKPFSWLSVDQFSNQWNALVETIYEAHIPGYLSEDVPDPALLASLKQCFEMAPQKRPSFEQLCQLLK